VLQCLRWSDTSKLGTIWCPSAEENIEKTPKQKNLQGDVTAPQQSAVDNKRFFYSAKKELALMPQHRIHQQAVLTMRKKPFCCTGDYFWKKDHPRNFTVACSMCKLLCHEYCLKICELTKDNLCEQCAHK
jgi:hypothetical protein